MENTKYVYVRFTSVKTFASWLIAWYTGGWPSHVEFVVGDGIYFGSDIDNGVKYIDDKFYEAFTFKKKEYFKIAVTDEEYRKVYWYAQQELGKGYDILALIGNIFRRNWQETDKWFCSEFIAYAFLRAEKPLLNYHTNRITPMDLLKSPLLIKCEESQIKL